MAITLPRDLEILVEKEVADGHFPSAEDLVSRAVRAQLEELAAFRAGLDKAEARGEREGWLTLEELDQKIAARREK